MVDDLGTGYVQRAGEAAEQRKTVGCSKINPFELDGISTCWAVANGIAG